MKRPIGFVSQIILLIVLAAIPALSQPVPQFSSSEVGPGEAEDQGVLPNQVDQEDRSHGVARVSLLNGDVSVRRGDSGDFVAAAINAPLLALDSLQTGPASRAEIQFDTANRVRFGTDTEARLSQLTADHFQLQVARGTVTWAVLTDSGAQAEIATPSVAIHPVSRGSYRVTVLPDGTTLITVRAGSLEVFTPGGVERVEAGQTMMARGAVENPEFQIVAAVRFDEWDQFNERRDRELLSSQSYNYVSRDIAGAEDLDNYGQWNSDPTYGQVWTPRVAADWAPYRLGRWTNEDYYGWTWVSADPWGWAPYHYGSWFQGSYGWSWFPGQRYSHHYYRPALVAFFGFGHGGGGGFGFGNVGWVPLAPYERFHPWYGRGGNGFNRGYGRGGTIVNNVNITNTYRNARSNNGVTSLNSGDFASGRFGRYQSPGMGQLQQAGAVRGQLPFAANSNHNRFNDRQTAVQPRTNFSQTRFADHMQSGTTLNRQTAPAIQQNVGGFGRQSGNQSAPNIQVPNGNSNWNRFGTPNNVAAPSTYQPQQNGSFGRQQGSFSTRPPQVQNNYQQNNGNASGWQRFGDPAATRQGSNGSASGSVGNYRQFSGAPSQAQQFGRGSSQAVQVAPPVVRERSTNFNQPQYNQPSYNQPRYNQSSPSYTRSNQPSYNPPSSSRPFYSEPRQERRPTNQPRQESSRQSSAPTYRRESNNSGGNNRDNGSHNRR